MRTKLSLCFTGLMCAAVFALVPLDAAEEPAAEDEMVTMIYAVADIPMYHLGSSEFKPTLLIAYLKTAVDPESWERGSIQKHDRVMALVIKQTRANHSRIADLLSDLRPLHDPREAVEENLGLDAPSR